MDWANRFTIGGFTVSYCTLKQMWEVIAEKDGIEVSYRWFNTKEKAEAFCMGRLYQTKIQR